MNKNAFTCHDAIMLLSFPHFPVTVSRYLDYYCGINQDGPPEYDVLVGFLTRMLTAGVLHRNGGLFELDARWVQILSHALTLPDDDDLAEVIRHLQPSSRESDIEWDAFSREEYEAMCKSRFED